MKLKTHSFLFIIHIKYEEFGNSGFESESQHINPCICLYLCKSLWTRSICYNISTQIYM